MRSVPLQVLVPILLASCTPAQQPLTTVAIRSDDKLMAVPLSIDGAPAWFMWDTGAPSLVIDPRLASELKLETGRSGGVTGTGTGPVAVTHAEPVQVRVGTQTYTAGDPWIIDLSQVPIPGDIRGLIGADLWTRYAVRMDSRRKTLELFNGGTYRPASNETAVPLIVKDGKMYLDVRLDVKPGLSVVERLRIDTGSGDAVNAPVIAQAREVRRTVLGNGLGQNFEALSGRIDAVSIGPFTIRDVWGPGGKGPSMGMEILRRFVVTFDATAGKLYLRPTAALAEPVPPPPDQ